ncbi:PQQ-dependent sugar dehydrogenase [Pendulispora brunnea]|uniref:PQQ-dependent sugar dehydrogenase n=1 Tax=Pendulispora brunnea TaxID=2905690 RepID=A0ABZ2KFD2_9BACT
MKLRTILLLLPGTLFSGFAGCSSSDSPGGGAVDGGGDAPGPAPVNCTGSARYDAWVSDPRLCVSIFATGLGEARQMAFAPNGDLFVNNGRIVALWDADGNGTSETNEQSTFASAPGLNHGLAFSRDGRFVYASSDTTVYRWAYSPGLRQANGAAEVVVRGIPGGGSHNSRTLVFDSRGRLYVNVGSAENVDIANTATRAQVRRFTIPDTIPSGGIDYASGEVAAHGMRNEVGLYVDAQDRLWGAENGRDNLTDPDFGGDIHTDNPGEEINVVDGNGSSFFGYPFCYSEYALSTGKGPGTEWADPSLPDAARKTDAWCADRTNVHPPAFVMPAHWAPLGIVQYTGNSLPFAGDFIIGVHGSWNRSPAVGRLLARAHVENGSIISVDPIVGQKDSAGRLTQGAWDARPVDVRQGPDAAIYFSDDGGGRVFKVGYARP